MHVLIVFESCNIGAHHEPGPDELEPLMVSTVRFTVLSDGRHEGSADVQHTTGVDVNKAPLDVSPPRLHKGGLRLPYLEFRDLVEHYYRAVIGWHDRVIRTGGTDIAVVSSTIELRAIGQLDLPELRTAVGD